MPSTGASARVGIAFPRWCCGSPPTERPRASIASLWVAALAAAPLLHSTWLSAAEAAPLQLEAKISLGEVIGRIDHLAVDIARVRLYVAELGNESLGVIDLRKGKVLRRISGLHEPQGIGYVPSTDTLYVANARDGSVRLFRGAGLEPAGEIALGEDSDNIRVDDQAHRVFVGYGTGAIAVIDTSSGARIADIPLQAHPESFRLEDSGARIFVNVPDNNEIAIVERATNKQVASWRTGGLRWNFPLALDANGNLLTVFRQPAKLAVFSSHDGRLLSSVATCKDSDDLFVDGRRNRVYVSCGEGFVDVFAINGGTYIRTAHLPTISGARTALFVPEFDRLYVAARENGETRAAIWVFHPSD